MCSLNSVAASCISFSAVNCICNDGFRSLNEINCTGKKINDGTINTVIQLSSQILMNAKEIQYVTTLVLTLMVVSTVFAVKDIAYKVMEELAKV